MAHSQAAFSEAKMYLDSVCRLMTGKEMVAKGDAHWAFAQGRCAAVALGNNRIGFVGEVKPEVIDAFGLGVPVSGFEVDLSSLCELLK